MLSVTKCSKFALWIDLLNENFKSFQDLPSKLPEILCDIKLYGSASWGNVQCVPSVQ